MLSRKQFRNIATQIFNMREMIHECEDNCVMCWLWSSNKWNKRQFKSFDVCALIGKDKVPDEVKKLLATIEKGIEPKRLEWLKRLALARARRSSVDVICDVGHKSKKVIFDVGAGCILCGRPEKIMKQEPPKKIRKRRKRSLNDQKLKVYNTITYKTLKPKSKDNILNEFYGVDLAAPEAARMHYEDLEPR